MSVWMVIGAIAIALVIAWLGLTALRAASGVGVDRDQDLAAPPADNHGESLE